MLGIGVQEGAKGRGSKNQMASRLALLGQSCGKEGSLISALTDSQGEEKAPVLSSILLITLKVRFPYL